MPLPFAHTSVYEPVWCAFAQEFLCCGRPLATKVWNAMLRAPAAQSTLYAWRQAVNAPDRYAMVQALFSHGPLHPTRLVQALEDAVTRGVLSRRDANAFEEHLLDFTNRKGDWAWL